MEKQNLERLDMFLLTPHVWANGNETHIVDSCVLNEFIASEEGQSEVNVM